MLREVINKHFKPRIVPFSYTTTASTATMNVGAGDFTVVRTGAGEVTLTARESFSRTCFIYATPSATPGAYVRWNLDDPAKAVFSLNTLNANATVAPEGTVDGFAFGFDSTDLSFCKSQRVSSTLNRTRIVWAKITGTTGAVAIGQRGITCSRTVAGTYAIKFTPGFGTIPVIMATGISTAGVVNCNFSAKTAAGVTITTAPQTATLTDADFYVMAIGQDSMSDGGKNRSILMNNQRKPRIVAGQINNVSGTITIGVGGATGGADFNTVVDTGAGDFSVTIASAFAREPALFATTASLRIMANYTAGVARFVCRNSTGAASDTNGQTFIFAIGSDEVNDY